MGRGRRPRAGAANPSTRPHPQANPAPYRFVWRYPRFRESDKVYMLERSRAFQLMNAFTTLKFWLISTLLLLCGMRDLSAKVWDGWLAWRMYNTSKVGGGAGARARVGRGARGCPGESSRAPPPSPPCSIARLWRALLRAQLGPAPSAPRARGPPRLQAAVVGGRPG